MISTDLVLISFQEVKVLGFVSIFFVCTNQVSPSFLLRLLDDLIDVFGEAFLGKRGRTLESFLKC